MGNQQLGLRDVAEHEKGAARLRLLAPLRYLAIVHAEKQRYDLILPVLVGVGAWAVYTAMHPKPPLFGEHGLLRFARDLLIMAVPFMVGALAAVSMGAPGDHLNRRPVGSEIVLDGEVLSLRQFLCYLLGYLSFLGLVTLVAVVGADLMRDVVIAWTADVPTLRMVVNGIGTLVLSLLLSALAITVLWSLYFLTDVANHGA